MYTRPQWGNPAPSPHPPVKQNGYAQPTIPFHPAASNEQTPPAAQQPPQGTVQKDRGSDYISHKIAKINGRDKVVDFASKLTMAKVEDFAMVHGCGGSSHSPNSTIGVTICDYTKGKGESSVTVRYSVDVEDITLLLEAAKDARLGRLTPSLPPAAGLGDSLIGLIQSFAQFPAQQDGSRQIPRNALNDLMRTAQNLRSMLTGPAAGTPLFTYQREKNNPYKVVNGLAPVSKIEISYTPFRNDGQASRYPWYIAVENFDAPLNAKANGATSHNAAQATNKRSAFINLTPDDFLAAMVAIDRFVRLWEHRMLPVMNEAYGRIERSKQAESNLQANATQQRSGNDVMAM